MRLQFGGLACAMRLNAFVGSLLACDRTNFCAEEGQTPREIEATLRKIEHLALGLALDLPNCGEARKDALDRLDDSGRMEFSGCGPNVPVEFSEHISERLAADSRVWLVNRKQHLAELRDFLATVIVTFLKPNNGGSSGGEPGRPFCADARIATVNGSRVPDGLFLWRYVSFDTFESCLCGRTSAAGGAKRRVAIGRRELYSEARIAAFASDPTVFLESPSRSPQTAAIPGPAVVFLGKPEEKMGAWRYRPPVFFVVAPEAPHLALAGAGGTPVAAETIACRLGLPDWIKWTRERYQGDNGFVLLQYQPEFPHPAYRPTVLDALEHPPFRPGPRDIAEGQEYRHGWTRVCSEPISAWDEPKVTHERGWPEVVLENRQVPFPSPTLSLKAAFFYRPRP